MHSTTWKRPFQFNPGNFLQKLPSREILLEWSTPRGDILTHLRGSVPEVVLRYTKRMRFPLFVLAMGLSCAPLQLIAQQSATPAVSKTKVIVDTDIGDDIDDAFALALAMRSPELEILGITTGWGDTELRAPCATLSEGEWRSGYSDRSRCSHEKHSRVFTSALGAGWPALSKTT